MTSQLAGIPRDHWPVAIVEACRDGLAGQLGIEIVELGQGMLEGRLRLHDRHLLVAGGLIHAGTVLSFADTCAGWGCLTSLPDTMAGFTTLEAKCNLLASARAGDELVGRASLVHDGNTTQVWDVTVTRDRGNRLIGVYRCTQMLLPQARQADGTS
jgi:1,4-dihydroxy-2-naphthoyl-CoA hydrolase